MIRSYIKYYFYRLLAIRSDVFNYNIVATEKLHDREKGDLVCSGVHLCTKHTMATKSRLANHGYTELKRVGKALSCGDCYRDLAKIE